MSFSDALKFPFQKANLSKILTIVLIFLIVAVSFSLISLSFKTVTYFFLLPPVAFIYGLFIGGYGIAVIQNVLRGETLLPDIALGRDLGRGLRLVIAGILYSIPFILVYVCAFSVFGIATVTTTSSSSMMQPSGEPNGILLLSICGLVIFMILASFVLAYAFIIGMIRFAASDLSSDLYDVVGNVRYVLSNLGAVFNLMFSQIGLTLIYSIVTSMISGVFITAFTGLMGQPSNETEWVGYVTVFYLVTLSINLMSFISSLYLFAQFGIKIGIMDADIPKAKRKHDYDDF